MQLRVPKRNWNGQSGDIRSTLQTWNWRWQLPKGDNELVLDFSEVAFLEPWALALFTAYGLQMKQNGAQVSSRLDPHNPCNVYLRQMGIEEVLRTGQSTQAWDDSHQNTGLHVISSHQDVVRFRKSAALLGGGPDESAMDALEYGMTELGRNVVQHAASPIGGVAIAQYFPEAHRIQIAICDCGIGVREALLPRYPEISGNLEALKLALLPHVSGAMPHGPYHSSENAGLGLFISKEICWRSQGSFWIVSRDALIGVNHDDASARERIYRTINPWPGTLVVMDLPSKGVEDFAGLIQLCNILASDARKSSGPAGLEFVQSAEELGDAHVVAIAPFAEDVEKAKAVAETVLGPIVASGKTVVLDFAGTRFVTQSFVHALLHDVFRMKLSLVRLVFLHCTLSTEEAIRAVAGYAASYRQIQF